MEKKGQAGPGGIFALVSFALIVIVGTIIFSSFDSSSSAIVTGTQASASLANITTQTYSGVQIISIAPVILSAVLILGIVSLLSRAR
jgi:hypothetical protein